jgi:carbon monoxide dehydrogenase subunit G
MEFSGSVEIKAPRDRVWAFVIDPQQVGWCGPGVESIEVLDATHYKAKAKVGVGYISARFAVNLELGETQAPDRAVIKASGQAPGSAVDAAGEMRLSGPPEGPTTMDWAASVAISGAMASLGARLIEGTARKQIGQAFDCMRGKLEA